MARTSGSIRRDLEAIARIGTPRRPAAQWFWPATAALAPGPDAGASTTGQRGPQGACLRGFTPVEAHSDGDPENAAEHFSRWTAFWAVIAHRPPGRYGAGVADVSDFNSETSHLQRRGSSFASGRLVRTTRPHTFSSRSLSTIHLPRRLTAFRFPHPGTSWARPRAGCGSSRWSTDLVQRLNVGSICRFLTVS